MTCPARLTQKFSQATAFGSTEVGQLLPAFVTGQSFDGRRRDGTELDRFVPENATEAEADHCRCFFTSL